MLLNDDQTWVQQMVSSTKRILTLVLMDALLLPLALWSAMMLRLGGNWDHSLNSFLWIFIALPLWSIPLFIKLGLYRAVLKYLDEKIVYTVFMGVTLDILLLQAVIYFGGVTSFPRSAVLIFWVFAMAYIGGSRFLLRGLVRQVDSLSSQKRQRVIIYGAGQAGIQLLMALQAGKEFYPVALVDDDSQLWHKTLRGIRVYPPSALKHLVKTKRAELILLAMPSVSRSRQREILESLETLQISIQRLPGMADLVSGEVNVEELKQIEIEDLLGRDPVPPIEALLKQNIQNQVVMVTGAGGSIGAELVRQIAQNQPRCLVLFERAEYALYHIHQEIAQQPIHVIPILGSVTDYPHLCQVMKTFNVETVYHAAAYKHVPMVEHNPIAGILNNVFGTDCTAQAAEQCGVNSFVLISTDKAVRPTNVMGATKRLAELVLQMRHLRGSRTRFVMVRFGNVLGSSGSVVPLFREQIKSGGPITLTHEAITRYFMTIPEAAQLVLQAGAMGNGGDVFLLDMGEPVKIVDLARRMVRLSGLKVKDPSCPDGDIEIQLTGLRPGEKLYEELLIDAEAIPTDHPRIYKAEEYGLSEAELSLPLARLKIACDHLDAPQALMLLKTLVREFAASSDIQDWVVKAMGTNLEHDTSVVIKS